MSWNSLEFVDQLNDCGNRYELENQWFKKKIWGERHQYVLNAWRLYRCANRSGLGMLILGSAKIRKDPSLTGNFGLTSAGGLSDPEELKLLEKLRAGRAAVKGAPEVLGTGSVLNDRNWTPLLNDAFILGGVHARQEFHVAEDAADAYFAAHLHAGAGSGPNAAKAQWEGFFRAHPDLLWMNNAPRIFARELVGLQAFGYRPRFMLQQLSFDSDDAGRATCATLRGYLDAVKSAGFSGGSKKVVLNVVSRFLFGHDWDEKMAA